MYFIVRDGTHFRHVLNYLRDPPSFKLARTIIYECIS